MDQRDLLGERVHPLRRVLVEAGGVLLDESLLHFVLEFEDELDDLPRLKTSRL